MLAIQQPYPFYYYTSGLHKRALIYFGVIFLFLWLFEPFQVNTSEQRVSYLLICIIHALSPALIFYVYFLVLNTVLPERKLEQWTVGKEIIHLCVLFFLIGVASFLVRDIIYTNPDNWSWRYFGEEVKNTFLGGSLLSAFLILLNFYALNKRTQKKAEQIDSHLNSVAVGNPEKVSIQTQVKADDFVLHLPDFLFAQAEGNYVEIYSNTSNAVKKELKRMTLSQLEVQLSSFSYIMRCHRAYIVNTRRIEHVKGNAQGYWLSFSGTFEKALVSRNKITAFDRLMK